MGVGVAASLLVGAGLGQPAPKPTQGQVTDLNWSSFSEEGLAYIESSRQIRIDLSRPPVEAAPLGLASDDVLELFPVDTGDTVLNYEVIVNGAGEGPGGARSYSTVQYADVSQHAVAVASKPRRDEGPNENSYGVPARVASSTRV